MSPARGSIQILLPLLLLVGATLLVVADETQPRIVLGRRGARVPARVLLNE